MEMVKSTVDLTLHNIDESIASIKESIEKEIDREEQKLPFHRSSREIVSVQGSQKEQDHTSSAIPL